MRCPSPSSGAAVAVAVAALLTTSSLVDAAALPVNYWNELIATRGATAFASTTIDIADYRNKNHTLRLDIYESSKGQSCGGPRVEVNGLALETLPGLSSGKGLLTLEDDKVAPSAWAYSCVDHERVPDEQVQLLGVNVFGINDEAIPEFELWIYFKQTAPLSLVDLRLSSEVSSITEEERRVMQTIDREISPILRKEGEALGKVTLAAVTADVDSEPSSGETEETSQSWLCYLKGILETIKEKSGFGDTSKDATFSQAQDDQQNIISDSSSSPSPPSPPPPQQPPSYSQDNPTTLESVVQPPSSPNEFLIHAFLVAALLFTIVSFFSVVFSQRQRIRSFLDERRRCLRDHHHDHRRNHHRSFRRWLRTREERRAARQARKQAIRDFFRRIFARILDSDAEKRAEEQERRRQLAAMQQQQQHGQQRARQSRTLRATPSPDTTLEQELVGFREAANMVEGLVRMGATRRSHGSEMLQQQAPPQRAPPRSLPGFVEYDDVLPAYEEEVSASSMVADGFRYGQHQQAHAYPGGSSTHGPQRVERSGDRLGYDK